MTLRLIDLEAPLEDVEFPDGTKHQPVPFGANEYKLWRQLQKETDKAVVGKLGYQIMRACYPTVTDDDIEMCSGTMLLALVAHAGRKIDQVREALKNAAAAEAATTEPPPAVETATAAAPSSPKTSGATSSRKSRARSGKTGGASSTASPTEGQSSSGTVFITSTTPNASMHFVESSTTSTAPS
jgi:hypothetical protein